MVTLGRHVMQQPDEDNVENQHQNSCYEDDDVSIKTESSSSSEENHDKNDDGLTTDCVAIASSSSNPDCISPPPIPTYGAVNVQNSNDVFIGNKTYYQGPVTIKQVLYRNQNNENHFIEHGEVKRITESGDIDDGYRSGCDNLSFNDDRSEFEQKKNNGLNGFPSGLPNQSQLSNQGADNTNFFIRHKVLLFIGIFTAIVIISLMTKLLWKYAETDPAIDIKLKIKSRFDWVAQTAINEAIPLVTPVPYVIIHHTLTENCTYKGDCVHRVRYIQYFDIESKSWFDIGYNFLVGGDGFVYEGRGWSKQAERRLLPGYETKSLQIAFIGTFTHFKPHENQIKAAQDLIEVGVIKSIIDRGYKLISAKQISQGSSPENQLYEEIKTWPHWTEKI